ncbi:MAG: hypothetical protein ACLSAH_14100 [Bilophila wadsworthia]
MFQHHGDRQALSPEGRRPTSSARCVCSSAAWPCSSGARSGGAARFWRWPMRCVVPSTLALLGFQFFFFRGVLEAGVAVGTVVAIGFSPIVVACSG